MYAAAIHEPAHNIDARLLTHALPVPAPVLAPAPIPDPSPSSHRMPAPSSSHRDPEVLIGIPALSPTGAVGNAQSSSTRSWTPLKLVGDGSFGTVWLCDWHALLPPSTPLSPMQSSAGARPEWSDKRLVAVKRMKKKWEGGWEECCKLKELESLRAIPSHPNIIPLYDTFFLPSSKELYFVFESMEGNLYQLIKSRRGRPLAGGLVASIYRQVVCGLYHIHHSGYFHRDMKPENLLVTTTGLTDYKSTSPLATPDSPPEMDVVVIIKLADFGLARETRSRPPYTEYVSTRWYRAPEVLLRSRDYSNPVDMWALGTILAELINLKPLFPGGNEVDQVARICQVLGDPNNDYGHNDHGKPIGGGRWLRGVAMARQVGFTFPRISPIPFRSLFDASIPHSLIDCIEELLKYDPEARLTSRQCLEHPYLIETSPRSPPAPHLQETASTLHNRPRRLGPGYADGLPLVPPRSIPPSHSESPANPRPAFNGVAEPLPLVARMASGHNVNGADGHSVEVFHDQLRQYKLPTDDLSSFGGRSTPSPVPSPTYSFATGGMVPRQHTQSPENWAMQIEPLDPETHDSPMDVPPQSPIVLSLPPDDDPGDEYPMDSSMDMMQETATPISHHNKLGTKLNVFGKKNRGWGFPSMFGHGGEKHQQPAPLPPVDELNVSSSRSTPSLKRTQSGSTTDSRSLHDLSPPPAAPPPVVRSPPVVTLDPKKLKKLQERQALDAEKQRRAQMLQNQRQNSRAVLQKREKIYKQNQGTELDWQSTHMTLAAGKLQGGVHKGKQREQQVPAATAAATSVALDAPPPQEEAQEDWVSHRSKARRREFDDDHSMSSSDVHSISRMSMISFASGDSDPGPIRTYRTRPSHNVYGTIPRATSISSLRTSSGQGFSPSARSSNSFDRQLVREFSERATFHSRHAGMPENGSGENGESGSPVPSDAAQWSPTEQSFGQHARYVTLPSITVLHSPPQRQLSPYEPVSTSSHPSSPYGAPHSSVNPMFQVPPFPSPPPLPTHHPSAEGSLPPCSHLLSVADQQEVPSSFPQSEQH